MAGLLDAFPGRFISEILSEFGRLPVGLLEDVLEAKAYRQAYQMVENADTPEARKRLPKAPLFALVNEIEFELAQEDRQD